MTSPIPLREQLLRFFDQCDRRHPGTVTSAGAAVEGSDSAAAYQAIREMAYGGVLALTTMPVAAVTVQGGRARERADIVVRPLLPIAPPLLVALPFLLVGHQLPD